MKKKTEGGGDLIACFLLYLYMVRFAEKKKKRIQIGHLYLSTIDPCIEPWNCQKVGQVHLR